MAAGLDLNNIKTQIKSILDAANIITADTDLSDNLATRIRQVFKLSPDRIAPQASLFPCVTIYVNNKDISVEGIAKTQAIAKRSAIISFNIAGIIWNDNFSTITEDPADEELEYLMENIEQIMRDNSKLNNTVLWSFPVSVEYFSTIINEQTHLRAGTLSLNAKVFY